MDDIDVVGCGVWWWWWWWEGCGRGGENGECVMRVWGWGGGQEGEHMITWPKGGAPRCATQQPRLPCSTGTWRKHTHTRARAHTHLHNAHPLQPVHNAWDVLLARATQGRVVIAAPGVQDARGGEGQGVHAPDSDAAHVLPLQGCDLWDAVQGARPFHNTEVGAALGEA